MCYNTTMNLSEYQVAARRTINQSLTHEEQIMAGILGMMGEIGELTDMVKKHLFQGHPLHNDKVVKEVGDCCWYLANFMTELDIDMATVPFAMLPQSPSYPALLIEIHGQISQVAQQVINTKTELKPYMRPRIQVLAGQILTGLTEILRFVGKNLNDCLQANITKLQIRYENGFSAEASLERRDTEALATA